MYYGLFTIWNKSPSSVISNQPSVVSFIRGGIWEKPVPNINWITNEKYQWINFINEVRNFLKSKIDFLLSKSMYWKGI